MSSVSDVMWVERHRPETLDDIVGNDELVNQLKDWAESGDLPNVFLAGPAGTGKTATAAAYAKDFYGDDWRRNFLEMNASDERGIDIVRNRIKPEAEQAPAGDYPYTIIFLDEADQLTKDSQAALRRVMEQYTDRTRFILSGNYLNQIIDPIQSRCAIFRVSPMSDPELTDLLAEIAEKEGLDCTRDALETVVDYSEGDARKAINTLQAASSGGRISTSGIDSVVGLVDPETVERIVELAMGGEVDEAQEKLQIDLLKDGVDSQTLADEFLSVLRRADMPADSKVKAIDKLAETEARILNGGRPNIQWSGFVAHLCVARHLSLEPYRREHDS